MLLKCNSKWNSFIVFGLVWTRHNTSHLEFVFIGSNRCPYIALIWKPAADIAPKSTYQCWQELLGGKMYLQLMNKTPIPDECLEHIRCQCTTGCIRKSCKCCQKIRNADGRATVFHITAACKCDKLENYRKQKAWRSYECKSCFLHENPYSCRMQVVGKGNPQWYVFGRNCPKYLQNTKMLNSKSLTYEQRDCWRHARFNLLIKIRTKFILKRSQFFILKTYLEWATYLHVWFHFVE